MSFSADQPDIVKAAAAFAAEAIRPHAGRFDRQEALDSDLVREMGRRKYFVASIDPADGGLGLDPIQYGHLTETLGRACCSARGLITVQDSLIAESLARWGSEAQKQRWLAPLAAGERLGAFALSEPDIGSDARGLKTAYEQTGSGFAISGRKMWISFGEIADFFLVFARRGERISAFLIDRDTPGVTVCPVKGLLGNRAAHLAEIEFENVGATGDELLKGEGSGFSFIGAHALDHGRYSIAWAGVAVAQECLDLMSGYAKTRRQFGQAIGGHQLVQGMLADAVANTGAARALCLQAGELRRRKKPDAVAHTSIAKYFASKAAMAVAADAVQVFGGRGCSNRYPVERLFREAKILEIIEGTSQIQQQIIAKHALTTYGSRPDDTLP